MIYDEKGEQIMAKLKNSYVCSKCGFESAKWYGKCPGCGEWNTMSEQKNDISLGTKRGSSDNHHIVYDPIKINEISTDDEQRYHTGMAELDRVLGGGIVKGSLVLLGGDPGIGKSTILMQMCEHMGKHIKILYVSGEESKRQLKLRAIRLSVNSDNMYILTQTDIESIIETIKVHKPDIVIIDSIQTMNFNELSSSPGSITQVRECTNALMRVAKVLDIPIIIVSNVTKDGAIAGPKVLEHIVDAVLYFEGDRQLSYRILRAIKNRYGSTNEIGVFEMISNGLREVVNPSLMLLSGRPKNVSGTCVACAMEGSRPILSEIQGLATSSGLGTPRRMSTGFDYNRMSLILAVLEKRAGYFFANTDVYINVVGGLRLDEPAVDLAVALSLISSLKDVAINEFSLAFGEIGLAGELRTVSHTESRIIEATRLGFKTCVLPYQSLKAISNVNQLGINLIGVRTVREAFDAIT